MNGRCAPDDIDDESLAPFRAASVDAGGCRRYTLRGAIPGWPFCFPHSGWEVVQLVGHQTLDLSILVRVQASQPIIGRLFAFLLLLAAILKKNYGSKSWDEDLRDSLNIPILRLPRLAARLATVPFSSVRVKEKRDTIRSMRRAFIATLALSLCAAGWGGFAAKDCGCSETICPMKKPAKQHSEQSAEDPSCHRPQKSEPDCAMSASCNHPTDQGGFSPLPPAILEPAPAVAGPELASGHLSALSTRISQHDLTPPFKPPRS